MDKQKMYEKVTASIRKSVKTIQDNYMSIALNVAMTDEHMLYCYGGYNSLEEWWDAESGGLHMRTLSRHKRIGHAFKNLKFDKSDMPSITKLYYLSFVVNQANVEEWLDKARNFSAAEIRRQTNCSPLRPKNLRGRVPSVEKVDKGVLSFTKEQFEQISTYLEKIRVVTDADDSEIVVEALAMFAESASAAA